MLCLDISEDISSSSLVMRSHVSRRGTEEQLSRYDAVTTKNELKGRPPQRSPDVSMRMDREDVSDKPGWEFRRVWVGPG